MRFILRPSFKKEYYKLSKKLQDKADQRLMLFMQDHNSPVLRNHELHGEFSNCQSINITGDYRAVYFTERDVAVFIRIGTHSELFGK